MPDTLRCDSGHEWEATDPAATCPACGAPGEPTDELPPAPSTRAVPVDWSRPPGPPALDGYDVGELVGRGGMAVVYKAHQRSLNRPVALKVLLVGQHFDADEARRIRAEAEAIARLQHPNVVHVYEVGERDGRPYLLMEFVGGGTLADRLKNGPVPTERAVAWAEAIARGVHAAHRQGIVHRDLKPANVLMTADGVPKITDFGIARRLDDPADRTRTGLVLGTPAYMAPEQAEGRKGIGPPADVWAVGAILYEMLTGRTPFAGESSLDLLRRVGTETPPRPSQVRPGVPSRLEVICLRCLEKDPAKRYPTAEALADDLARFRAGPPPTEPSRRGWGAPVAVGVALLLVAIGTWRLTRGGTKEEGPSPPGPIPGGPNVAPGVVTTGSPAAEPVAGEPRWEQFRIAADDDTFEQLAFPTRDVGYAVSRAGVYRTDDGGARWRRTADRDFGKVLILWFADADHGWLGADQLFRTDDGGKTWNPDPLSGPDRMAAVRALVIGPDGWGLVGGNAASGEPALFRRRPGETVWQRIDPAAWDGKERPHRTWFLGGLSIAGRDGWAVLFAAADQGVVLHTGDGGETWAPIHSAAADLFQVQFIDPRRGWLAGGHGQLWATDDGGHTWSPQTNPGGDTVVRGLSFACGKPFGLAPLVRGPLLQTGDGRTWHVVPAQLGNDIQAAVVVDPGRAVVLAQDGRIARYSDPKVRP